MYKQVAIPVWVYLSLSELNIRNSVVPQKDKLGGCPRCGTVSDVNSWSSFLDTSDIRKGNISESLYCLYLGVSMHCGACYLI